MKTRYGIKQRIHKDCGGKVKAYVLYRVFDCFPFLSKTIYWCRGCQHRVFTYDWNWEEL